MASPKSTPGSVQAPASLDVLRDAVSGLGDRGMREVQAVRDAFVSGQPPLPTFSSGSKSDFIGRFGSPGVASSLVRSTAQFGLQTSVSSAPVGGPRPELDFIEVGTDRAFGVLDCFFARVVFSISTSDASGVSYFRVLRAKTGNVSAPIPSFSALADSTPISSRTNNPDLISNSAFHAATVGVGNSLTRSVREDAFSKQRVVVTNSSLRALPPITNTNKRGPTDASLVSLANADRSVLENVGFYLNRRNGSPVQQLQQRLSVGQRHGMNVLQGSVVGTSTAIVTSGNSLEFAEVARVPVSHGVNVGAFMEFEYWDASVVYGGGYSYYIIAVSNRGVSGTRSRIVPVSIVRNIPPASPSVSFYVAGNSPRFSISCSGTFTDHVEVFWRGGVVPESVQLLSTDRAMIDSGPPARTDSSFYHIGDIGIGSLRSSAFVDRHIAAGQNIEYRIYSVDSFGLKCATPFSCSISLPERGSGAPLGVPSFTVQQLNGDRSMQVTVESGDDRITAFVLTRRELTSHEQAYRQVTDPAYFTFGRTDAVRARSRSGPSLSQFSSHAWSGILTPLSGAARFIDTSVQFDRIYQYSVMGVDTRGNRTVSVSSSPILVSVKPSPDAPTSVTGTVLLDPHGSPMSISIQWVVGTVDFSPSDMIGDQNVLSANSQRSVFQVERRETGRSAWSAMPATTASSFIDIVSDSPAPKFRPPYALPNASYDYRVIAMQSGAFISAYTDPVRVTVVPPPITPEALNVRSSSTAIRPIYNVLSWQYVGVFVDSWEIERAVTNKVFGSRIQSMDSSLAGGLSYESIAKVTRESSRGLGISADGRQLDSRLFTGNRSFIDRDVSMSNSYFYRVRSLDSLGRPSAWAYCGIMLTDSPFDRKFMSSLSDADRSALAMDPRPLPGWEDR